MQLKVVPGTFESMSSSAYSNGILLTSHLDTGKLSSYDYLSILTPKVPSRQEDKIEVLLLISEQEPRKVDLQQRDISVTRANMTILLSRLEV